MSRHFLQGCPHEENDPVTRWRHCEHIAYVVFIRICAVSILVLILIAVVAVMP